jgi:hypothetical protein
VAGPQPDPVVANENVRSPQACPVEGAAREPAEKRRARGRRGFLIFVSLEKRRFGANPTRLHAERGADRS